MSTPIARLLGLYLSWPALALASDPLIPSQMEAVDLGSRVAREVPGVSSADATLHPPPDLEDLWLTLLLRMAPSSTLSPGDPGSTWYVSVSLGGANAVDLPATAIAKTQIPGINILPASAAPGTVGNGGTQGNYHVSIGMPAQRPDGNYDVVYGYYCGPLCAASKTAVMFHDHWGWHIISTRTNWVS